jgi:hypothetical protein
MENDENLPTQCNPVVKSIKKKQMMENETM